MKTNAMAYEDMPLKINRGSIGKTAKKQAIKTAEGLSTAQIMWLLVKRHKVGLLALGNIVLILNWAFPAWTELVKSLF